MTIDISETDDYLKIAELNAALQKAEELRRTQLNEWILDAKKCDENLGGRLITILSVDILNRSGLAKDKNIKEYYTIQVYPGNPGNPYVSFGYTTDDEPFMEIVSWSKANQNGERTRIYQPVNDGNTNVSDRIISDKLKRIKEMDNEKLDVIKLSSLKKLTYVS